MAEQTMIQVRVDSELKEQAASVFDRIGIDIPTAVRMFFKAAVREQRLPFSTDVSSNMKEPPNTEKLMDFVRSMIMYESPIEGEDEEVIAMLPLEYGMIPGAMFVQLVTKIPEGRISCWEDIFKTLEKLYGMEVSGLPDKALPKMYADGESIPYWRVITNKGILGTGLSGSREFQREHLLKEGIPVVQRGSIQGSYRVENYKDYLFDFSKLKVVKTE